MKTSTLTALFAIVITFYAGAQTSGGGGGGGTSGASGAAAPAPSGNAAAPVPSGSAATPATGPAAPRTQPGMTQPNQNQQNQVAPGFAVSNNIVSTNQFGMDTNMQGTNLSPTTAGSGTNQMMTNNFVDRDDAVTDNDRDTLVALREKVRRHLGVTPSGTMPVHFFINNGVVIIIGFLPTSAQCQHVLQLTQQAPGVSQVINRLRVGTPVSPFTPATVTTNPGFVGTTTDRGFSPSDRDLLLKVQQQATLQLGLTPANGMQLPVHFSIQDGVVSVMGQVLSPDQKQRLLTAIHNVQGVTRVVDNVSVGSTSTTPANNNLAPTSTGQTNTIFQNSTNGSMQ